MVAVGDQYRNKLGGLWYIRAIVDDRAVIRFWIRAHSRWEYQIYTIEFLEIWIEIGMLKKERGTT